MAFENTYGEVASSSVAKGYYDEVNDSYAEVLQNLLPRGPAWVFDTTSEMYALLRALSYSYLRTYQRGQQLLKEYDPRTCFDMLEDWEIITGLPGTNPNPPTALEDRRAAVLAKLRGYGDPTNAYYTALALAIGYRVTILTTPYDAFVAGSLAGMPLTSDEWAYVWEVYAWEAEETVDNTAWLEWTLDSLKPNHTLALYRYFLTQLIVAPADMMTAAVAYDTINEQWCAVGAVNGASDATILTSPNGAEWTERTNPKAFDLYSVTHDGAGTWVAVGAADGADSYLINSADAQTWAEAVNPKNFALNAVAFGAGVFVAAGAADGTDAYIVSSPDGAAPWTERVNPKNIALHGIAHNRLTGVDSLFVAVGGADGADAYIVTSPDGFAPWTERANPKNIALRGVTYGNGLWVAVGDADGTDSYILTSPDGVTWTERTNSGSTFALAAITYSTEAGFVAVGEPDGSKSLILSSWDGITWTEQGAPQNFNLAGIAVDNLGRPIAVGFEDLGAPPYDTYILGT